MATRIQIAKPDIVQFFESAGRHTYRPGDLKQIVQQHRDSWRLAQAFTANQFIQFLLAKTALRKVVLTSDEYRDETRFIWRSASDYEVALSLKPNSYLSHGTAVFLHALNDQLPATIYVNHEQSPKQSSGGKLLQAAVDRAFKSPQRQSKYIFNYGKQRIVIVNGKHTGRLEVGELPGPGGEALPVTKIERTLIDIAVRPSYAGGTTQVLEAYKAAKSRASVNTLVATLKKLNYVYPYHQVIGFYLERAGFEPKRLKQIEKLGHMIDFYATYGLKDPEYSKRWRLFYPRGL